jgi:2-polyprenyl-6-methoxyphenol hydroxylase-like FAD-dependent oxidoreductase
VKAPLKALVVGGGVGGIASAIALRQIGIDSIVFERRTDLEKIQSGAGLLLWQNAMRALQRINMAKQVEASGGIVDRMEWRNPRGDFIAQWPVEAITREVGAPAVGILRATLSTTLAGGLEPDVLRLAANCLRFEEDPEGIVVHLDDGTSHRGDFLIGADGVNSMVRSQLHGSTRNRYAGYTLWHGHLQRDQIAESDAPGRLFRETWGVGTRFGFYPVLGELYWFCIRKAAQGGSEDESRRKAAVLAHVGDWDHPARMLVELTPDPDIQRIDIVGRAPMRHWGHTRITLLGDSAHAMTPNLGQGACQAIEDAVVLAKTLERHDQLEPALRDYEAKRRGRTASFQVRAWLIGSTGRWENPVLVRARDRMMKIAFPTVAWRAQRKDMAYEI